MTEEQVKKKPENVPVITLDDVLRIEQEVMKEQGFATVQEARLWLKDKAKRLAPDPVDEDSVGPRQTVELVAKDCLRCEGSGKPLASEPNRTKCLACGGVGKIYS